MWLYKRLSDWKSSEVTYHRLLPGQQLQFDEAMTKELSQVLAANAVRRLSQEEELNLKLEHLLRMRWVLTWKYTEGGDRKAKARLVILGYQHPELTSLPTAAPTLGKMSRHLLLQACALHKLRVQFGDVSSAFLQTSASEEYQELTIKAPPEVGYLFSDSERKPARYVRLVKSFNGLTSAPRAWWLDVTQKLSQLGWKPMSTDQCLWCRDSDDSELKGVIGIHVDDFLIGLADGALGEKWMSEIKSLSEFAEIRVRQHRDFSITVDLEDYTNKFITEAPITRERSRQRQESLTAQELSMLRGVLGTASWRAQQMSLQFAVDVSLLLSATADPVVQDLLDANKRVRDMRRSSAESLHFHSFNETPWQQLVFASWADAGDRPRPDGSRTGGYVITVATEKLFGHGQEDCVSVMAWRSFKLPRKIGGSNNGETQALAFADESLWLVRLAWSEMHGASMRRWHLDETVRQVGGMLITDSRGFF